jgi:GT2 family glycosyltransferase
VPDDPRHEAAVRPLHPARLPCPAAPAQPPVSIVLTSFNGLDNLRQCLPAVLEAAAHDGAADEILVVDDCSTDGSVEYLEREHPGVRVVALERRSGFLGAANAGFRAAKNHLVALLSNDMTPQPDFLSPLVPHFADPEVFAVSACLEAPDGHMESGRTLGVFALGTMFLLNSAKGYRPLSAMVRDGRDDAPVPTLFTGGNALYDRDKVLELGGFDPLFHPFYWEDTDLCYRAWKRGWKVVFEPGSGVTHHQRLGTIRRNYDRHYIRTIRTRNRLLFLWKNLTDRIWLAQHMLALAFQLAGSWAFGRLYFYRSFAMALARLDEVLERRRRGAAGAAPVRGDREVLRAVRNGLPSVAQADVAAGVSA